MRTLLITTVVVLLLQGCTEQYEHRIQVAKCAGGGLYARERVETRRSLSGRSVSPSFSLYYMDSQNRQVPIETSSLEGSETAAGDRLKIYTSPQDKDWHLYVAPSALDPAAYDTLADCIGTNLPEIQRRMSAKRAPYPFVPEERTLPRISTIRYADLKDLRKEFQCEPNATIRMQENRRAYFETDVTVLLARVTDAGTRLDFEEGALRYLKMREKQPIPDPLGYLGQCRDSNGVSLLEAFHSSTVSTTSGRS